MVYQVEMVNLEELVSNTHQYRQFSKVFDLSRIEELLCSIEKDLVLVRDHYKSTQLKNILKEIRLIHLK